MQKHMKMSKCELKLTKCKKKKKKIQKKKKIKKILKFVFIVER